MSTLTIDQEQAIREWVTTHPLVSGLGDVDAACSVAAINLAVFGRLTDAIPGCMSKVIGKWVIATQDAMSDEARNSDDWRLLLPYAAGTGRDHEDARLAVAWEAMWEPLGWVQPVADELGFGEAWATMLRERTKEAAADAADAAYAAADAAYAAADAAYAAAAAHVAAAAYVAARVAARASGRRGDYDRWAIATLRKLIEAGEG